MKQDIVHLTEWRKQRAQVGFTTRHFPLILHKTDELLKKENQERFATLLPFKKFALLDQIHGDGVIVLDNAEKYTKDGFYHFKESDAAITDVPGIALFVFSADCLPVFLYSGNWVGLVHAGWRGSQKKITQKTVQLILEKSGQDPKGIKVLFGPCISARHYEVGAEFKEHFPVAERSGKYYFDLAKESERQIVSCGVPQQNISDLQICTFSENQSFYSFRKEGDKAGRIISFIVKTN